MLARALRASLAVSANKRPSFIKWNTLVIWDVDCLCTPRMFDLPEADVLDLEFTTARLENCIHRFWLLSKLAPKAMPVLISLNGALWYADDEQEANAPLPAVLTGDGVKAI